MAQISQTVEATTVRPSAFFPHPSGPHGDKFALVHFEAPQVQDRLAEIARHDLLFPELSNLTPPKHTKWSRHPLLRITSFKSDQISPTAHTLTSTRLSGNASSRSYILRDLRRNLRFLLWQRGPLKPDGLSEAESSFCTARRYRRPSITAGNRTPFHHGIQSKILPFLYTFGSLLKRTEVLVQLNQGGNKRFNPLEACFEPRLQHCRKWRYHTDRP